MIIRISPELSQDLTGFKPQQSISWAEPWKTPQTPLDSKDEEAGTPRMGRSRHRSSSTISYKGKEKEISVQQTEYVEEKQQRQHQLHQQNDDDRGPLAAPGNVDARTTSSLPTSCYDDMERLPPTQPLSPLGDSIKRMTLGNGDDSVRLARLADWLPSLASQTDKSDIINGTAPSGDKERE